LENELKNALNTLKSGETILYPTDTIWGIGCDAMSDNATKKIFEIKKRDYSKGLICLVSSFEMVQDYADISEIEKHRNESNETPTTFIFENPRNISSYVLGNNNSIAFRVPNNNFCIRLIEAFGRPLVSSSANLSGNLIPKNYDDISPEIMKNVGYIVKLKKFNDCKVSSRILKYINDDGRFHQLR